MAEDRGNLVDTFVDLTGVSADQASEYLTAAQWDFTAAVEAYYADVDEEAGDEPTTEQPQPEPYTGPRTLDGRPAPEPAQPSASKKPPKRTGLATLSSLGGGHDDDDDDDDDDEDYDEGRGPRDLFAGGEKSGLAVQDPAQGPSNSKKLLNHIFAQAKSNASRPDRQNPTVPSPHSASFRGGGQTLGGDGVPSRAIPDPRGEAIRREARQAEGETQERVLHLWNDGFSIDDGPLRRFDDPQNAMDLNMIRQGRAPLHLMNVRLDQPVDVKLQQHHEDWHQLPRVYRPFSGEGRRLGSPVPGESRSGAPPATTAATGPAAPQGGSTSAPPSATAVDESQPTVMIRIQLPDGTRLPARFNTTQTVSDVYQFVERASPATQTRSWVLATTFPNKDHTDRTLVLGEMPEFKKGGAAVVKWV